MAHYLLSVITPSEGEAPGEDEMAVGGERLVDEWRRRRLSI